MSRAEDASGERGAKILDFRIARERELDRGEIEVIITPGTEYAMQPINWLWPGWLAGGKMHILGGAPGTGKTTIALSLAAALSSGGAWPDASPAPLGSVLIWSGEDDPADTLIPRLVASEADLYNVYIISSVVGAEGRRQFDPATDAPSLIEAARNLKNLKLLIIDPIVSAVRGDSHKNAETRRGLQPLVDFASRTGAALVGITHLSKGTQGREPLERLSGSLAFGAMARIVWGAVITQDEQPDGVRARKFLRIKSNIGPDGGGYDYSLLHDSLGEGIEGSRIVWGGAFDDHAREVFSRCDEVAEPSDKSAIDEAADWLADYLSPSGAAAKTVIARARENGHKERTLKSAKSLLGIKSIKTMAGNWEWQLPRNYFGGDTGHD